MANDIDRLCLASKIEFDKKLVSRLSGVLNLFSVLSVRLFLTSKLDLEELER